MLSINNVHMMVDVVIVDPTQIDLVSWITLSCGVVMTIATQVKDGIYYHDRFPMDMSLLLIVEFLDVYTNKWMSFFINH